MPKSGGCPKGPGGYLQERAFEALPLEYPTLSFGTDYFSKSSPTLLFGVFTTDHNRSGRTFIKLSKDNARNQPRFYESFFGDAAACYAVKDRVHAELEDILDNDE